jgi:hypothetical protein
VTSSRIGRRSPDPLFIGKVRDIVGLYLNRPDKALVLCVDERAQIQALDRSQLLLPMRPGQVERRTHDYVRHGTTSLFAALDAKTGRVMGRRFRRHRAVEFRKFLDAIDTVVSSSTSMSSSTTTPRTRRPRSSAGSRSARGIICTSRRRGRRGSTSSSADSGWLTEKQLRRGIHRSARDLETAIDRYVQLYNAEPRPFRWTKTADEILASVARFCHRISDSGH